MRRKIDERNILEAQLIQAKKDLFKVNTIRELKLLQNRIYYLNTRIKEIANRKG
ncbi:MAG: hypothetical protein QMD14_04340 [Candidatus Aenigmarchaeota archaeon]|nr:hypothetical protein [Candidatus Aenigmarchaeota archaeon]